MSELLPPQRPTRAGKTPPREAQNSLLMTVIRTLSNSESNEQREHEKKKLEKEYKRSDTRLDTLVVTNTQHLKDSMQIFSVVSGRLAESRERLKTIKENLAACKRLLHCKRDELKERWLEGIEHKHVMLLLEQIEEVEDVGERIGAYVSKRHYLHATQLLTSSLKKLGTDLKMIEALKDVDADLQARKERLHSVLLEDLHNHVYQRWSKEVLSLRRYGSGRDSLRDSLPFSRSGSDRNSRGKDKVRKNLMELMQEERQRSPHAIGLVHEDLTLTDPESDSKHFMAIIIESLALIGKLPEAVETMKSRMQKELTAICQRTSKIIMDAHPVPPAMDEHRGPEDKHKHIRGLYRKDSREAKLLQDLLQAVYEQFQMVVLTHQSVLGSIRLSADRYGIELVLYTMPDIWSKVQAALQCLLMEYLDLGQLGTPQQQSSAAFSEATTDLSSFFSKKRTHKPKNYSLYKFDASYHAITMNNYLMEQGESSNPFETSAPDGNCLFPNRSGSGREKKSVKSKFEPNLLVCRPSPHNITAIFKQLQSYIKEIEDALGCAPGTHCTLSVFVMEYVKDAFLAQLHVENAAKLEHATKALDQWRTCKEPQTLKSLKVSKPILQSTLTVWESIEDLMCLLSALPSFSGHFLSMMCNTLLNYKETCLAAYRGITQPDSEDKRIISATWAKDEDIKRFLKGLPNWQALQDGVLTQPNVENEENPEEISERNRKETEILTGNLGEQLIPEHEILADPQQLRILAHLQESMEWFSTSICQLAASLPLKSNSSSAVVQGDIPPVSDATVQTLTSLAKDFEELAQTCLIVLHLEVRLHCFFYLLPVARQSSFAPVHDTQEADGEVIKLNKDLSIIDEALSTTLESRKCKYIFEGLGPLIANILTAWVIHIKRINGNGIKKMCRNIFSIQQQLTNLTMTRELALDKARQYYEMMYLSEEEVLNGIVNRGKQFTEIEYMNALQLLHRSHPGGSNETLQVNLQRLSEILGDVGVTV